MRLQDIKDGKVKVTNLTSITYNGSVYRGKKEIMALVDRVLPLDEDAERLSNNATAATDSAPAAGSTAKSTGTTKAGGKSGSSTSSK